MFTTKHLSRTFASVAGGAAVLAVSLASAGSAQAATTPSPSAHIDGYTAVQSCTGLTGSIAWTPGLVQKKLKSEQAVFTGTLTGCSGYNGAEDGTGTVTAVLNGTSKIGAINESGSITVNWPASSGLNPSNGTVSLVRTAADQPFTLAGHFTSGAYTSAVVSTAVIETGHTGGTTGAHPTTAQSFVNTQPLAAKVNFG